MKSIIIFVASLLAAISLVSLPGGSSALVLKVDPSKAIVPVEEIISGGPPPDGIPPIDMPRFITVKEGDGWLKGREPVIAFALNGDARAYPLQIMTWHEIVNDVVGGHPVMVTF